MLCEMLYYAKMTFQRVWNEGPTYSLHRDEIEGFILLSRRLEETDKVEAQKQIRI